jgi:anti-sigma factor ChrR (cupin superfamily)
MPDDPMTTPNDSHRDDAPARLDADILAALADGQAWEAPTAGAAAALKRRLLLQVAAAEQRHLTVPAGEAGWQPFQPGVAIKVLHEQDGVMSYLLKLAPGAVLSPHRHPVDEECLVLEGRVTIGADLEVGAGGFHLARRDALHAPITSAGGATLFLRGASPHPGQLV